MTRPTLIFFGVPRVERAGTPLPFVQAKGIALLLYLAVTRTAQPRERLIALLWPESLPQAARKNMRNTLWAIGEGLGADLLIQDGGTLRLAPEVVVDIHGLEAGVAWLEHGAVTDLEQAVAYYRGALAEGLVVHEAPEFELWLQRERERLTALYLRLLERIIALQRTVGAWQPVLLQAQRALAADPLREAFHLALIEAYVQLGQRPQAMLQYATLTEVLQRELGVPPLLETTARYETLLAAATMVAAAGPPLPLVPARPAASQEPPAAPFVGRTSELATLEAERGRAATGEARVVMITGDLGMGKTQLWRTWVETYAPAGAVLTTYALETTEPVPFAPLLNLFRQPGPAQALLRAPLPLAPIWLAELARLLPELAVLWPNLPPLRMMSPTEERARLLQALTEVCRLLTMPLLVLVMDDLHWADPSTLDWLIYLVDQLKAAPLLLIGAYRPQDAPAQLVTTVAGWQRQGRLRHLPLAHLTTAEAQTLLTALGTPAATPVAAGWIQQSGGNPYFLTELQRAQDDATPHDLTALVRARIHATVPAPALQVLQATAILGEDATLTLLQATSGRNEEELLDALDRLTQERVLMPVNQSYHFVHPLVATVLRADLTPARRAVLHRRAAEALERQPTPPSVQVAGVLMAHFAAANLLDRAAHYAELAAEQAAQVRAFVEAAAYARHALAWAPTAAGHLLLGKALLFSGSAAEAQSQLERALQLFEQAGDLGGAANASLTLAIVGVSNGQFVQTRRWLAHPALAQVEALNPALYAEACLIAATVERQSQEYATALTYLTRAEHFVRELRLAPLAMQAAFERGNLLANRGEIAAAVVAFAEARQVAEAAQDVFGMAFAGNNLAYHTLLAGDADHAQLQIEAAITLTERYKLTLLDQFVYSTAGEIALARQELPRAEDAFARAFAAAQERDNRVQMANVRISQALVAQARHNPPQAQTLIEEATMFLGAATDQFVQNRLARVRAALA